MSFKSFFTSKKTILALAILAVVVLLVIIIFPKEKYEIQTLSGSQFTMSRAQLKEDCQKQVRSYQEDATRSEAAYVSKIKPGDTITGKGKVTEVETNDEYYVNDTDEDIKVTTIVLDDLFRFWIPEGECDEIYVGDVIEFCAPFSHYSCCFDDGKPYFHRIYFDNSADSAWNSDHYIKLSN